MLARCLDDLARGAAPPAQRGVGRAVRKRQDSAFELVQGAVCRKRARRGCVVADAGEVAGAEGLIDSVAPWRGIAAVAPNVAAWVADYYQSRYRELLGGGLLAATVAVAPLFLPEGDGASEQELDEALATSGAEDAADRLATLEGLNRLGYLWCPPGQAAPVAWGAGIPSLMRYSIFRDRGEREFLRAAREVAESVLPFIAERAGIAQLRNEIGVLQPPDQTAQTANSRTGPWFPPRPSWSNCIPVASDDQCLAAPLPG